MTNYEAAYAYPSSIIAKQLHRDKEGCHYVQVRIDHEPPEVALGPCDSKEQAETWAKLFNA